MVKIKSIEEKGARNYSFRRGRKETDLDEPKEDLAFHADETLRVQE